MRHTQLFGLLLLVTVISRVVPAQGLSAIAPAKEYIRLNGQLITVENYQALVNGSFESGMLNGWTTNPNASLGSVSHSGAYGLTEVGTSVQDGLAYQDVAGLIPGQMYQVSVWLKAPSTMINAAQLYLHDTVGNGAVSNVTSPATSWQQISAAFTATTTGKLRIHLVDFSGTIWWDDVAVTPLPPNGDFEGGLLSPWTTNSNASIGSVSHSGAYGLTEFGTSAQDGLAY